MSNKVFLIIQREFLTRVKKKSFLLATLLIPLIFPAVIGGMIYLAIQNEKNKEQEVVQIIDKNNFLQFQDTERYRFEYPTFDLDTAKQIFSKSKDFALIYIPKIDIYQPKGILFYAKSAPGINVVNDFEFMIGSKIRDIKLTQLGLTHEQLDMLKTSVHIESINIAKAGGEKKNNAQITFGIGYVSGFLIYIFLFIYGGQVMQGVIEEKSSKTVEIIVSTIRPFQMMLGKVVGVASVGIFQFLIWIVLISIISFVGAKVLGFAEFPPQDSTAIQLSQEFSDIQSNKNIKETISIIKEIPILKIVSLFMFYFVGGYFLYGALFAAVGSAVDSPSDAQQFMLPIMLPIIVGFMGLFIFVFNDPHGNISFWLSIIPFTSPIVMIARINFGVPLWEIILSILLLILGFIFTLWLAGRIYRIGILMYGSKINYKVLFKWLMMKN